MESRINYTINILTKPVENKLLLSSELNDIILSVKLNAVLDCQMFPNEMATSYELNFSFAKDYLSSFGEFNLNYNNRIERELCCTSQLIAIEIINTKYEGLIRNIFIESKALELLLCLVKCDSSLLDKCNSCKFLNKPYEKEKIYKARDILLQDLVHPPIIPELAKLVGINQCYLKKGFKDLFNTTIFAFVQEQRIARATHLLRQTSHSISEISDMVGFSNPSNFTNSYKSMTGLLPSQIRNN
ncbi:MAG: AraC family transcriptional regulator [Saprospiraceae bacterium]|nr:helix-turn-helix transcriptional regulator [Saprospiraceae bacterium]